MNKDDQPVAAHSRELERGVGNLLRWSALGIQKKILVPVIILMLLSLLGSTIGFILSTNATRDSILARQLTEDSQRLRDALRESESIAAESAILLANDDMLNAAMQSEQASSGTNESEIMSQRAITVRERFGLDQVIITDASGQARVNIAPSFLEPISVRGRELLPACNRSNRKLVQFEQYRLLIICEPITLPDQPAEVIGDVYAILDIDLLLQRTRRDLELNSDIRIASFSPDDPTPPRGAIEYGDLWLDLEGYQFASGSVALANGAGSVQIALRRDVQSIEEVVSSGLRVNLISSAITLVLLLVLGVWLARSLTRPILKLSEVAEAVAAGDLSRRAQLHHEDEIGKLGRSFDQATSTIADLLDQRERAAGERQAMLESIADGVLAVDTNERILVLNPAAAALLNQDAEALIGQPLAMLKSSDDPLSAVGLQQVIEQVRSELTDEDRAPTEDQVSLGEKIVRIQSAPTLRSGGEMTGAVVVIQDVTRAVELDRAKSEFIAIASHELRTPLASLKGFVDMFMLNGLSNLNESQQLFLATIKRQTEALTQLVNDLIEMARLEQGTQRAERRWIAPATAIEESLTSLNGLIEKRAVTVERELAPNLPPVWIDNLHFRRILTNMISNAVKYVYQGGHVQIRAYSLNDPAALPGTSHELPWNHNTEDSVVIEVSDNGVGIREEDQPNVFNRFFRSENPLSVEVGGTGLGLAITHALVAFHEGQIGFQSTEGQGSQFWLRLPISTTELLSHDGHTSDESSMMRENRETEEV